MITHTTTKEKCERRRSSKSYWK